ncbi:innexin inx2-like [Panulirus ornatus]|uniref:innexin inx2-like n=1 Tax=Panulirus ornatus TaxID=150431 RepID=UPI003A879F31
MMKYLAAAKILKKHNAQVDNAVFHLHYRVTFVVFIVSGALVTAKEFIGAPIQCISKAVPTGVLNTFCFIMSTFSVPRHWAKPLGDGVSYPGVGPHEDEDEIVYHAYYQWVPFVLVLQAIMFYVPRYLWKNMEGGLFTTILAGLDKLTMDENARFKKHKILSQYMIRHLHMHMNWAIRFFLCEALCLVVVVGNIYFTDLFLGGTFLTYGTEVINFPDMDPENRVDPMTRIFPRVTKCTFRKFGSSGTIETHDTMCVLAVNIINEKIYIFIWFWLVCLTAITALWLVYRLIVIASSEVRLRLLQVRGRWAGRPNLDLIAKKCNLGDWFLIYHLGRNMEPMVYGEFLKEFARELENSVSTLERKPMLVGS